MWDLYRVQPSFVLGFHGTDAATVEKVLAGEALEPSDKPHDWLGGGVYFWEGSPQRALEWAEGIQARPYKGGGRITKPAVVGAVIDLGVCCNLFDSRALAEVADAWGVLQLVGMPDGSPVPDNEGPGPDRPRRLRDRAVIEFMHGLRASASVEPYDTVRAPFLEGEDLYENAGFKIRNHVQIAVRNPDCIKGYFRPIPKRGPGK